MVVYALIIGVFGKTASCEGDLVERAIEYACEDSAGYGIFIKIMP